MKTAVVVGGEGFIGEALVKKLRSQGVAVDVVGRTGSDETEQPCDVLIWAAGYTADYAVSPYRTIRAHAADLARVVESKRYGRLIYLSSTRLFDGLPSPVSEETPLALDPAKERHLYDLTKATGEWVVRHRGGPRAHVLRLSGVYGDALNGGSFLESMVLRALDGDSGLVETLGSMRRDYIHLEDVCRAVMAVAKAGQCPVYNVASGELVTNVELFGYLKERTGTCLFASDQASMVETRPPELMIRRLEADLGIVPMKVEMGLDRVLTWQDNQRAMRSMLGVSRMPWM